jgi:cytosine/adenosine deaminase-related metal-dependent hydrolase
MNGNSVVEMAAYNNAKLASHYFKEEGAIGVVEEGAQADLILVDYIPFTDLSTGNLPWHIVFGFRDSMVTMTMAAGRVLMKDRQLLTLDEDAITARASELSKYVWKRYQSQFKS